MKKKTIVIIIVAIAAVVVAALIVAAVVRNRDDRPSVAAVVLEVGQGADGWYSLTLFTAPDGQTGDLMTASIGGDTKLIDSQSRGITVEGIRPGQLVEIIHSGEILESYPGQFARVFEVRVTGEADGELYERARERRAEFDAMVGNPLGAADEGSVSTGVLPDDSEE